jgi:sugar phosphate isomerase/epimerase
MKNIHRRDFLLCSSLGFLGSFIPNVAMPQRVSASNNLPIQIFSKLLHFLDIEEMAARVKEMGFAGIDLTVRPEGHVLPEKVTEDLPKAFEIIRKNQLDCPTIVTSIQKADENSRRLLQTAAQLGIKQYRAGWLKYPENMDIGSGLVSIKNQLIELEKLNRAVGIVGAYQNHSGDYFGASIWDFWEVVKDRPSEFLGIQFDIRHATVEGGNSWVQDLHLIYPLIKSINLKDFIWYKDKGKWQARSVPLGTGMVDFIKYFKFLRAQKIQVPVSLHLEYDLGGAENGQRKIKIDKKEVFKAMQRDLAKAQELWEKSQ